jgi:predicted GTPase
MLETWSREYRAFIIENVPFSQNIKLSTLRNMSSKTKTAYQIYKVGSPIVTMARIAFSPVTGIAREITSYLVSKQMSGFSEHVQKNMKHMLFEQVTQVAIDLYSGRLQLSEQELLAYRRSLKKPEEPEVRPLSVMIIGQVNAGKSSLVNALKQQCVAEIDVLPATKGFSFHQMLLSNGSEISLIDTPGVDGSKNTSDALITKAVKADLLLWVSQVNQPAKALDKQLIDKWNDYFSSHKERKKPPILLVTTHNDMLTRSGTWHPPYDLSDTTNKKVVSMMEALRFTHQTIGLPKESFAVPVAFVPGETPYNIDVLRELLVSVSHEARAAQLNKERLEATDSASIMAKGLKQCVGLVKVGVNLALK